MLTSNLETSPRPKPRADGREQEKLDNPTRQPVNGRNHPDAIRIQAEPTREVEGQVRVVGVGHLARVVQEDGEELVGRDRVEREKRVSDEVDGDVAREDVAHPGCRRRRRRVIFGRGGGGGGGCIDDRRGTRFGGE